jgi:iron complex transport system substrate-binding protein
VKRFGFAAVAACFWLAACAPPVHRNAAPERSRIVALVPFVADDVYALGAGSRLIGVSAYTDDPRARSLPRVADFTSIDAERIAALHPDVAIGIPAQQRLTGALRRAGIAVVLLPDDRYPTIFSNLETIGRLCGRRAQAASLIRSWRSTTEALHARTRRFVRHPSVFFVLGTAPIWTAGSSSFIATLIALAGGRNAAGNLRAAYGQYSAEALLRAQPDVLVADPAIGLHAVLGREPWRSLRAVRLHRVYAPRSADVLQRPGPRYNEGIRWLLERLTPLAT